MKFCKKCGNTKDYSEFYKKSNSPDGLQYWCRLCMLAENKSMAEYRYKNGPTLIRDSKVCKDCGLKKPITQFYVKNKHSADGYGSYCKPCWVKRVQMSISRSKARKNNQ